LSSIAACHQLQDQGHESGPMSHVAKSARAGTPMPDLATAAAAHKWGWLD
jgi:hypothetical protein